MRVTESRNHIADSEIPIKAQTRYLEHVRIAVVGVLHHHHLDSGQRVRDAVLVFVAYGLKGNRVEKMGEQKESQKRGRESKELCRVFNHVRFTQNLHKNFSKDTDVSREAQTPSTASSLPVRSSQRRLLHARLCRHMEVCALLSLTAGFRSLLQNQQTSVPH